MSNHEETRNSTLLSRDDETIIAQCTPAGKGAIALLRLSGVDAIQITDALALLGDNKRLQDCSSHTIHYGWVCDERGQKIDQVMFLLMHGPRTFTGQNTVEITCHNNLLLIEKIISKACSLGARLAHNGEFTKRAVLHGKIDLIQAEAINELIQAGTSQAVRHALAQVGGSLSRHLTTIEQLLSQALAFSEVSFEFLDDDTVQFSSQINALIHQAESTITELTHSFNMQRQIKEGFRIAIIGSVNAGKSSLFNALVGKGRAIVSATPGTTRDVIEMSVVHDGNFWTMIDTAGLRQGENDIECEGIERSYQEAHLADVIALVMDGSRHLTPNEHAIYRHLYDAHMDKVVLVVSKSDLPFVSDTSLCPQSPPIMISTHTGDGVSAVYQKISDTLSLITEKQDSPFLINYRQIHLLQQLKVELAKALTHLGVKCAAYELVSHHLIHGISLIGEITGKTATEHAINSVFHDFCIGK